MTTLASLIRLRRWQLDEKRRALAELQVLADRLGGELDRLEAELAAERRVADQSPDTAVRLGAYLGAALRRRERLNQSARQVERQMVAAQEEIAAAFQDLKRIELTQDGRDRRAILHRRRAETMALDEIALTRFQRQRAPDAGD